MKKKKIGIALSGGGYRALVFQLGVLKYLAEKKLFKDIKIISTVSGGSITPALIFKHSNMEWPTDEYFLQEVLPKIRNDITSKSLKWRLFVGFFLYIWRHVSSNGAKVLASILEKTLGIKGTLQDLPDEPRWIINSASYQTGKNWRFEKAEMGDWVIGFTEKPNIQISEAVASSCGLPGLVGSLKIKTKNFKWKGRAYTPQFLKEDSSHVLKKIHLWDGALYDNFGFESVFKPDKGLHNDIEQVIAVDASFSDHYFTSRLPWKFWMNLFNITLRAGQNIRTRVMWKYIKENPHEVAYIKIGRLLSELKQDYDLEDSGIVEGQEFMSDQSVKDIAAYPTDISRIKVNDYDTLFNHGYQVAQVSLVNLLGFSE